MSKINWDNIVVTTTILSNQIVVGRISIDKKTLTDKSDDRTNEVVSAVHDHMKTRFERMKENDPDALNLEFIFPDGSKLVYKPSKGAEKGAEG